MLRTVGRTDGPSYTCSVSWDFDPGKLIRPRSADSIKASGHGAASKGRTHDRKRPRPARQLRKSLHAGGHPHMTHYRILTLDATSSPSLFCSKHEHRKRRAVARAETRI